jgi:hypothetical protein
VTSRESLPYRGHVTAGPPYSVLIAEASSKGSAESSLALLMWTTLADEDDKSQSRGVRGTPPAENEQKTLYASGARLQFRIVIVVL